MSSMDTEAYEKAAEAIRNANTVVALTGAGASVESGIPDFRSPGGLWTTYPPQEYATIEAFHADPDKVWTMWYEFGEMLQGVSPNKGHLALAELEQLGYLHNIVTQNIDNLHQNAGCTNVIEYHGNASRMFCPACHRRRPLELAQRMAGAPLCVCGGNMKPDVVMFGEPIPPHALHEAAALAHSCDVMLIVGTSATVYPAAGLPFTASEQGAFIVECNIERTEFTRTITDAFLQGPFGETLPKLLNHLNT